MEIAIIAYSGHAYVVIDAAIANGLLVKYYCDKSHLLKNPFNLSYLGNERDADCQLWKNDISVILGIGDNNIRYKVGVYMQSKSREIYNVIHPKANIASVVTLGIGNFFAQAVSISPLVTIGNYCILNTASVVEHGCVLGDAVHVAPAAVLAGDVQVGHRSFVGANSVVRQGVKIGCDVIIGAGAVVLHDVKDGQKMVGNPARSI